MANQASSNFVCLLLLNLLLSAIAARPSIDEAANAMITTLPGQPADVSFAQYSGYVTINERKRLFYWLVEASSDAESKPLILWLNGGPGSSSIGYGAFQEIGPFQILPDGKLSKRQFSWNIEANLLFLDSPAGVGFSILKVAESIGDNSTGRDLRLALPDYHAMDSHKFLKKWLKIFPKYKFRDFYIAGQSYAGHYAPQLAQLIVNHNKGTMRPIINLKGILLGNPLLDDKSGDPGMADYLWNNGLLSDITYQNIRNFCAADRRSDGCNKAWDEAYTNEFGDVNNFNLFMRPLASPIQDLMYRDGFGFYSDNDITNYLRRKDVQEAFHIRPSYIPVNYTLSSDLVQKNYVESDTRSSMLPVLEELIKTHLRIWIYSGTTDIAIPLSTTRGNIAALKLKLQDKWYPWNHNNLLGGWTEVYNGLTFVAVLGAGHEVPMYLPSHAHALFKSFLSNTPMPRAPRPQ